MFLASSLLYVGILAMLRSKEASVGVIWYVKLVGGLTVVLGLVLSGLDGTSGTENYALPSLYYVLIRLMVVMNIIAALVCYRHLEFPPHVSFYMRFTILFVLLTWIESTVVGWGYVNIMFNQNVWACCDWVVVGLVTALPYMISNCLPPMPLRLQVNAPKLGAATLD
jgi:hypothetical protein